MGTALIVALGHGDPCSGASGRPREAGAWQSRHRRAMGDPAPPSMARQGTKNLAPNPLPSEARGRGVSFPAGLKGAPPMNDCSGRLVAAGPPLGVPVGGEGAGMNYDTLIVGGRVIDGTGNPWFYGDVAIAGERIVAVAPPGRLDRAAAREVVEAAGQVVTPGFIDIQSHSILPFLTDTRSLSKITQGVTTEIMGEAWTPAPFGGRIES